MPMKSYQWFIIVKHIDYQKRVNFRYMNNQEVFVFCLLLKGLM